MPTPEEIDRLLDEAADSGRRAEDARMRAELYYQQRRKAVTELRKTGVSFGTIARRLGITRSGVQAILRQH